MSFRIHLEPEHIEFDAAAEQTLLEAASQQGVALPYGCRNGLCGMCKAKLLEGKIDYRQAPLGLSHSEQQQTYILCCQAQPRSNLRLAVPTITRSKQLAVRRMPCRVEQIDRLSHDVLRLSLKLPDSFRFQFFAGQYIDFILKDGRRRSFSIANAPQLDNHIELHVRHIDGGRFTGELFEHLQVKAIFRIEGPLGHFYLRDTSARPVILMAGGTGFAPIKGMIEDVIARAIPRLIYLYWGARRRVDLYQHDLAQSWAEARANIRYIPVLSDPEPGTVWTGRTGFVHAAVAADFADLTNYEVYASGPPAMIYAARDVFAERGLAKENYFSDAFEFAND